MSFKHNVSAFVLAAASAAPATAWAFTGVGGCSGLPEYYRALGALQGGMESACNMSADTARQILSTYGAQTAPLPRSAYRRHRGPMLQP